MSKDLQQLRTLSVFHYVVAGLAFLFSLFPTIHLALGIAMATGGLPTDDEPVAEMVGLLMAAIAGGFILLGWIFAGCLVAAGRSLASQKRYTFCLVMAALALCFIPFGTVLGVFTIIVLMRDSVRALFEVDAPDTPASSQST